MKVIPFVHEGLGNSSYVVDIGDGKALLIDPDRTAGRYLEVLDRAGLVVAGVFETHLHADFVSGARELHHHTDAPLFLPEEAHSALLHTGVAGGQSRRVDGADVSVVASPGHTPEHVAYVVRAAGGPPLLFSGGSLIVGGAARTDLISPEMTEPLTRAQYRTLHRAFSDLPDETLLYPTHGGGSFCSTGTGGERTSTLGRERAENPLLSLTDEDEFAQWFPSTFPAVPDYFLRLREVNRRGPRLRQDIASPVPLGPDEFAARRTSAVVVDARGMEDYAVGHIPGSLNNTLRDVYAVWLGWLVPEDAELLFVVEGESDVERLVEESLLVGFEHFAGWLQGGIPAWQSSGREVARIDLVDARDAENRLAGGAASLDVREPDEYATGHIAGSLNIPLGRLGRELGRVPQDRPLVVNCGHGERSSTAISMLEAAGWRDLSNLNGGIGAWTSAGYDVTC
jgi:glyoxylase-like metal-dependent hydrolase (beta-lactamase superfamily II)/rhodanese-related sulfurtransferase